MTKPKTMLEHALAYADAGIPVIPLHTVDADGHCSCDRPAGRCTAGKHPRISEWQKRATTDPNTIKKWWGPRRWPNASIGGVGGEFVILDIDPKHDGTSSLKRLIAANAELPETMSVKTGKFNQRVRGTHFWFRVPGEYNPGTRANVREGIDIRCIGGYAVLPPSPHPSGVHYEWKTPFDASAIAEAPEWLCELTPEYVQGEAAWAPNRSVPMSREVKQFLQGELEIAVGEQRAFLCRAARSVLTQGRNVETTSKILWEGFNGDGGISNCDYDEEQGPWMPEHIYELVSSEFRQPPSTPLEKDFSQTFTFDDAGNAKRLVASFPAGTIHFAPAHDCWYIWDSDERRYFRDGGAWMRKRWIEVIDEFAIDAQNMQTEDGAKQIYAHASRSRMKPKIDAATQLARDLVSIPESQIDNDHMMFQVANGAVDLRTGEFREAEPEDHFMRGSGVEYDPDAESDLFEEFLERTLPDPEVREYLQIATGYSLTGRTDEHVFFYLYGLPATGKTTYLEALKNVCGTYGMTASSSTILANPDRSGSGPTEDIARLAGARMVSVSEIEPNARFAAGLVSSLVGGESVTARHLRSSSFEYMPRFKLWIGANHLPKVAGAARSGVWRRVKVIPFDQPLAPDQTDHRLAHKLREPETASAILAWAVRGSVKWWKDFKKHGTGITDPTAVEQEVAEYKLESDHVAAFAQDALNQTGNRSDRVPVSTLFNHYNQWCDAEGRKVRETQHALARKLKDLNFKPTNASVDGKVQRCWIEVELTGTFKAPSSGGGDTSGHGITIKGSRSREQHTRRERK